MASSSTCWMGTKRDAVVTISWQSALLQANCAIEIACKYGVLTLYMRCERLLVHSKPECMVVEDVVVQSYQKKRRGKERVRLATQVKRSLSTGI